jgi:Raf kinase inhibitor-like YbhB/YbcL family protein
MSASAAGSGAGKAGSSAAAGSGGAMSAAGGSAAGMSGGTAGGSAGGSTGGGTLGGKLMYTGAFTMGMMPIPAHNKCPNDGPIFGNNMGDNKSPPLSWTGGPAETKSFAIVLFDTKYMMLHWVLWDIPPTVNMLTDGEITPGYDVMSPMGAHQVAAMGGSMYMHSYYGPCSSGSSAGTYEFRLYALNKDKLMLTESSTGAEAQMAVEAAKIDMTVWSGMPM